MEVRWRITFIFITEQSKRSLWLGTVAHICNPRTCGWRQENQELKVILGYLVSWSLTWAPWDPISKSEYTRVCMCVCGSFSFFMQDGSMKMKESRALVDDVCSQKGKWPSQCPRWQGDKTVHRRKTDDSRIAKRVLRECLCGFQERPR